MMKKILFITGTRADYGKVKSLIRAVENDEDLEAFVYVSGMHLSSKHGSTYHEILKDGYTNVYIDYAQIGAGGMSYELGTTVCHLSGYVLHNNPDMIVIHGDRIDALAGAIVGALNNIRVAHIEGGELSGTIDESIRHAVSKLSHIHFVSNDDAKQRLIQLGEEANRIFVIGSPDIDIMLSNSLPSIKAVKERYSIPFEYYGIVMYHPVTTHIESLKNNCNELVSALIESNRDYVVVYPNNDAGSEIILHAYEQLENKKNILLFPSLRFEYFLTLLKNADCIIGNSSAGIREAGVYGVPAIDLGTRQEHRYALAGNPNIQHVSEKKDKIIEALNKVDRHRIVCRNYGRGDSTSIFIKTIKNRNIWELDIQKHFVDLPLVMKEQSL